jgi:hypothetical protein
MKTDFAFMGILWLLGVLISCVTSLAFLAGCVWVVIYTLKVMGVIH